MITKVWASLVILSAASLEVYGHAAVAPVIGLGSTPPQRSDVKRPLLLAPCGLGVNIASALGQSTPVQAAPDGTFTATVTNFNPGIDGSRQMTAQVDAGATGKNFVAASVTQNGDKAPTDVGSQQLVVSLPAGTNCTGGTTGDTCLVSFKSAFGFGNCVAVQQGASNTTASANSTTTDATATDTGSASTATGSQVAGSNSTDTTGTDAGSDTTETDTGSDTTGTAAGVDAGSATGSTTTNDAQVKNGKSKAGGQNRQKGAKDAAGAGQGNAGNGDTDAGNGAASAEDANTGAADTTRNAGAGQGNQNLAKEQLAQGGTRAPKALLANPERLNEHGEEAAPHARRGIVGWIWA